KNHVHHILRKLGVRDRFSAAEYYREQTLLYECTPLRKPAVKSLFGIQVTSRAAQQFSKTLQKPPVPAIDLATTASSNSSTASSARAQSNCLPPRSLAVPDTAR